jgi:hypothetical protein
MVTASYRSRLLAPTQAISYIKHKNGEILNLETSTDVFMGFYHGTLNGTLSYYPMPSGVWYPRERMRLS